MTTSLPPAGSKMFLHLVELVRSLDNAKIDKFRAERNYEALEVYILEHLLEKRS